jgi:3-methyladenine DNA glycosylase AlkC
MNELLNAAAVNTLRSHLEAVAPDVEWVRLRGAATGVDGLSLRARSDLVSAALLADFPDAYNYTTVAALFRRALAGEYGGEPAQIPAGSFSGWMIWPVTETVTTLALADGSPQAFDDGLGLLAELTPRLTAEFAIRRFLEADLDRALAMILGWTRSPDEHVRRLASEGTRAFLPWAIRVRAILAHPEGTVPILDALRGDPSEYVRRSVANHLNDLARQSPRLVTSIAENWMRTPDANTAWVVRHGLRTLVKKADPAALAVMGFTAATVTVGDPVLESAVVPLPGALVFTVAITNDSDAASRLAVDYLVYYQKANGTLAGKVFKLTTATVGAHESISLRKSHAFRQMTTRVHYEGEHALELQVNGQRFGRTGFTVAVPVGAGIPE